MVLEDFKSYAEGMSQVWAYFQKVGEDGVDEIVQLRNYFDPEMSETLRGIGFIKLPQEVDLTPLKKLESYLLFGLESKSGSCLLAGRFVFPVRDLLGNILAFIGWYPDIKKYITTPSKYFSKSYLYFGLEQVTNKPTQEDFIFLTEGIFDAITLRSLGFKAYASMGVSSGSGKQALHHLISEGKPLVGVPDCDRTGRNILVKKNWGCSRYLTWYGDFDESTFLDDTETLEEDDFLPEETVELTKEPVTFKIKDVDDLCKFYEGVSVKQLFLAELKNQPTEVVKIYLTGR